jgi:hypothetical protein
VCSTLHAQSLIRARELTCTSLPPSLSSLTHIPPPPPCLPAALPASSPHTFPLPFSLHLHLSFIPSRCPIYDPSDGLFLSSKPPAHITSRSNYLCVLINTFCMSLMSPNWAMNMYCYEQPPDPGACCVVIDAYWMPLMIPTRTRLTAKTCTPWCSSNIMSIRVPGPGASPSMPMGATEIAVSLIIAFL